MAGLDPAIQGFIIQSVYRGHWMAGSGPAMMKDGVSRRDLTTKFVFDVDTDDIVKGRVGLEAERQRAFGIEIAGPA